MRKRTEGILGTSEGTNGLGTCLCLERRKRTSTSVLVCVWKVEEQETEYLLNRL